MATITATEARALYTKMLVDVFKENIVPTSFLTSFFTKKQATTKNVSIEVQRGTELIAVDVIRGSEGNRNTISLSTEKIFTPPFYREYFEATELEVYDRLFGSTAIDASVLADFVTAVQARLSMLVDKIKRAIELQCSQVFETGIITLANGTLIDYKRKPASIVAYAAGNAFAIGTVDPYKVLAAGCQFLRETGKSQGGTFNAILGSTALANLFSNTIFVQRQGLQNMSIDTVVAPQRNSVGGTFHGQLSCESYKVNIWSYPEIYETSANGVISQSKYINDKKIVMLPEMTRFVLVNAAVPQIYKGAITPVANEFVFGEYVDERETSHVFDVKSAPVAVPVAVDQMYTIQVVA